METLEQESDYIFNYDPELLKSFYFTGKVDLNDFEEILERILYDSPYTYELNQNTILVYQPDQKTYRICGTIQDAQSKEPLIAANIVTTGTSLGSYSDIQGFFDFEITADKNQKIEISYLGYKAKSFSVQEYKLSACPTYSLDIDKSLSHEEIIITGYILDGIQEGSSYGGFELNFEQLSKNHSNVEHDILKTVQLLPGINSIDDSATNLQIRGSNPDQNLILWEGVPIYNAGHIFGMSSAFNPFSVDKVSIFKGAYDPQYDNRVGGIIDISLVDSIDNVFRASLGSTLTEVHANVDIPIVKDHLALVLSGRQSISGLYTSPTLKSYKEKVFQLSIIDDLKGLVDEGLLYGEEVINYNDWNAKLIYQVSDRIGIHLGTYGNQQDFKYLISFPDNTEETNHEIEVNTKAINGDINFTQSKYWSSSLSFYNSFYQNEYSIEQVENSVFDTIIFNSYNSIDDRSYKFSNTFDPTPKLSINAGYEFNTKEVNVDLGEGSDRWDFETLNNEFAGFHNLFLSTTYTTKKIKFDAGIRTSHYQERKKWVHSPRMNFQYYINKQWKLKADAGIYHQMISKLNDFGRIQITRDNPLWILNATDTQLPQKAHKFAAGFVFQNKGWLFDVDSYYNHTTGLNTVSPTFSTLPEGLGFSKGSSTTKGLDILLKKRWSGFNTWVNYSLRDAKNNFPEISESSMYAPNDIRHNLSLVASYKLKDFQFSLNTNFHSGLPFSIPYINYLNLGPDEDLIFQYELAYNLDKLYSYRLKPYTRLDFSINYRPSFKKLKKVKAECSINFINLLNSRNVLVRGYYLDFETDNSIPKISSAEEVLLSRTPQVLVRFYW